MARKRKSKFLKQTPRKTERRYVMITDFGQYLRSLRFDAGVGLKDLSAALHLSPSSIINVELGYNPAPRPERLSLWLRALGRPDKYPEALLLLQRIKKTRAIRYQVRHPANEHIDRIIDAYEGNRLDPLDIELLRCIALREYRHPEFRPNAKDRTKRPVVKGKEQMAAPRSRNTPKPSTSATSSAARQLGSKGGKQGGPARARKLSSTQRSQIASKGGKAKSKTPKSSY